MPIQTVSQAFSNEGLGGFSFRNKIINGGMEIDQRNAGASVTITGTSTTQYILDRYYLRSESTGGSKVSVQQSTVAPAGFKNSYLVTSLSAYTLGASEHFAIVQAIEGNNIVDLGWGSASAKTVTLSFKVRSSLTGTFGGFVLNSAANRCFLFSYTINAANTWEDKIITIPGDTTGTWETGNGIGMYVNFSLGVGSSLMGTPGSWSSTFLRSVTGQTSLVGTNGATFYLTGVQLEVGSVATPFERRPIGMELQLCQRYYQKTYDLNTVPGSTFNWEYNSPAFAIGTGNFGMPCGRSFLVPMRGTPTITTYDGNGNSGKISQWSVGVNQSYAGVNATQNQILAFDFGNNTTAGRSYPFAFVASAEL